MEFWAGFFVGLWIGGALGFFAWSLVAAGSDADDEAARLIEKENG